MVMAMLTGLHLAQEGMSINEKEGGGGKACTWLIGALFLGAGRFYQGGASAPSPLPPPPKPWLMLCPPVVYAGAE